MKHPYGHIPPKPKSRPTKLLKEFNPVSHNSGELKPLEERFGTGETSAQYVIAEHPKHGEVIVRIMNAKTGERKHMEADAFHPLNFFTRALTPVVHNTLDVDISKDGKKVTLDDQEFAIKGSFGYVKGLKGKAKFVKGEDAHKARTEPGKAVTWYPKNP